MAEVFLAAARGVGDFEKLLCIKRVLSEYAKNLQLLINEAKIVSHISHPNIALVFDLGRVEDQYYIAMEYVDGMDAFGLLRASSERDLHVPCAAAAMIVRDVTEGLAAAHRQTDAKGQHLGIIHRDISPHNVLVSYDGDVKVIDFGVAKATLREQQTQAGVIKGKYNYLSPEQAQGEPLDPRTDVFSAGIVLFELLAGEPLYPGENIAQLLDLVRKAKIPSMRKLRPDVPAPLTKIMNRALQRNRAKRYGSAGEMAEELTDFLLVHAADYRRSDLAELVSFFAPPQTHAVPNRMITAHRDMQISKEVSIVSAPGALMVDSLDAPVLELDDLDLVEVLDFHGGSHATTVPRGVLAAHAGEAKTSPGITPPERLAPPAAPAPSPSPSRVLPLIAITVGLLFAAGIGVAITLVVGSDQPVVSIDSTPPGATIFVDGQTTGALTPFELSDGIEERGRYEFSLQLEGYRTWTRHVQASGRIQLLAAMQISESELSVSSSPGGATVIVGGETRGRTPVVLRGLEPTGTVTIELTKEGYRPVIRYERMRGRQHRAIEVTLEPL